MRDPALAWLWLLLAGVLEVSWAIGMKYTDGWTRTVPSVLTVAAMAVSLYLLALAVRVVPVGTAYAVWTGIGAVGTALLGMWLFDESRDVLRVLCLVLIVAGIAGLKLLGQSAR